MTSDRLHVMDNAEEAIAFLTATICRPDDLVLVKGSRAIGMERIVGDIATPVDRSTNR